MLCCSKCVTHAKHSRNTTHSLPSSLLRRIYTNEEEAQDIIRTTPSIQHITTTIMHQVLSKHSSGGGDSAMKYHILDYVTVTAPLFTTHKLYKKTGPTQILRVFGTQIVKLAFKHSLRSHNPGHMMNLSLGSKAEGFNQYTFS